MQSAVSFGEPLPRRVVRGIVLSRLTNFIEGHSGVTPGLAEAVAAMLDGRPLPDVPRHGNGGSGEISALGALFGSIGAERQLQLKESMSLINGSPCASALTADAALCAADLIGWAQRLFGLAATALGVSAEIFDARLDELWGDPFQAQALAALREQLGHATAGQEADAAVGHVQPPVSFRIIPRVVGNALRVLDEARTAARTSLGAVSDNPTLLFDGDELVDIVSTGGFHNGTAAPVIDSLAATVADLAALGAARAPPAAGEPRRAAPVRRDQPRDPADGRQRLRRGGPRRLRAVTARASAAAVRTTCRRRASSRSTATSGSTASRRARWRVWRASPLSRCTRPTAPHRPRSPTRSRSISALSPPLTERRSLGPELAALTGLLTAGIPA